VILLIITKEERKKTVCIINGGTGGELNVLPTDVGSTCDDV
jgi:hypothetical protein